MKLILKETKDSFDLELPEEFNELVKCLTDVLKNQIRFTNLQLELLEELKKEQLKNNNPVVTVEQPNYYGIGQPNYYTAAPINSGYTNNQAPPTPEELFGSLTGSYPNPQV